jgi:hypothetical protein
MLNGFKKMKFVKYFDYGIINKFLHSNINTYSID